MLGAIESKWIQSTGFAYATAINLVIIPDKTMMIKRSELFVT
jgi:hypothetical protein